MTELEGKYTIEPKELGQGAWSVAKPCRPINGYQPPNTTVTANDGTTREITSFVAKVIEKNHLINVSDGNVARAMAEVEREVSTLRRLPPHANIATFIESLETSTHFYIIFEAAPNGDLCELILATPNAKLEESVARRFTIELIRAVIHCHEQDIAHRDIKPENLLVGENKTLKLTDFGLAKHASVATQQATSALASSVLALKKMLTAPNAAHDSISTPDKQKLSGKVTVCSEVIGTPRYGAPEMFHAKFTQAHYDGYMADTWAVGVVVYIMLTGNFPFSAGTSATEKDTYKTLQSVSLSIPSYVSKHAGDFIKRLLVKDPRDRMRLWMALDHPWLDDESDREALDSPALAKARANSSLMLGSSKADVSELLSGVESELKGMRRQLRHHRQDVLFAKPPSSTAAIPSLPPRARAESPSASGRRPINSPAPTPTRRQQSPLRTQPAHVANGTTPTSQRTGVKSPSATRRTASPGLSTPTRQASTGSSRQASTGPSVSAGGGSGVTGHVPGTPVSYRASPLARTSPAMRRGTPARVGVYPGTPTGSARKPAIGSPSTSSAAAAASGSGYHTPHARHTDPTAASRVNGSARAPSSGRRVPGTTATTTTTAPSSSASGRPLVSASPGGTASSTRGGTPTTMMTTAGQSPVPLQVGEEVVYKTNRAIVRFNGPTTFAAGNWLGLEMVEGNEGLHDGTSFVDKKRYFTCPRGKGVFVRSSQVRKVMA